MRPWLDALLDDATGSPADHRHHQRSSDRGLLRALVVPDHRLAGLSDPDDVASGDLPLRVHVQVTGGAGALEPAVRWAARVPGLDLASLGIALRDEEGPARNAGRVVAMLDHLRAAGDLADETPAYVEVPRVGDVGEHAWGAALDELAMADLRLTLRVGGDHPDDVPGPAELARSIDAALDRELAFRTAPGLGTVWSEGRHGLLNVLLATRTTLDGGDPVAALTDPEPLASYPDDVVLTSARRWFTAAETRDLPAQRDDLARLGLLSG